MSIAKAEQKEVFDFNIPRQGIESALNALAGSTSKLLLFPYETVQLEESNPVVGRCTLTDALSVMLQGTGLRGDLTESGVITISQNINEVDGNKMKKNKSSRFDTGFRFRKKIVAAAVLSMCGTANVVAQEQEDAADAALEEVIVTGIRASLSRAADVKRNDKRIVDAIVAEDIGKLPDNNIAEALQRITGVSLNRDFGVGEGVSIRGLSQNRVELNGRTTVGDSRDGIALDDFPASFVRSIEVVKSPTADMIEGALGGTVSLKTFRPLELNGLTVAGSVDGEFADKTEEWAPVVSGSIGNNWDLGDAGSFGAIFNVSYQDREIRQDNFNNNQNIITADSAQGQELNALLGPSPAANGSYVLRDQNTLETFTEVRERTAANLSLQWAPASGAGNIYFEYNTTDRSGSQDGNQILEVGGSAVFDSRTTVNGNGDLNNYTLDGAFAIPKTWAEFRETESDTTALGGEWNITDRLRVSAEVSRATSDTVQPRTEFNLRPINRTRFEQYADAVEAGEIAGNFVDGCLGTFNCRSDVNLFFSQSGDNLPSVTFSDQVTGAPVNPYLNPENLTFRALFHNEAVIENEETAARIDFEFDTGSEIVHTLKAGYRATEREYNFVDNVFGIDLNGDGNPTLNPNNIHRSTFDSNGRPTSQGIADIEALFPGSTGVVARENLFSQTGRSGQFDNEAFLVFLGTQLADLEGTFDVVQGLLAGTNLALSGDLADNRFLDQNSFRDITEDTDAFYVTADIDYGRLSANIGVRYVETDLTSTSFENGQLVTDTNSYDDTLPSVNINYRINDSTQLRFAYAEVLRRPDFVELSSALNIDTAIVNASSGSVELDPFRATQYDLSLEHYWGSGNVVSVAIFYKDIESFLNNTSSCAASPLAAAQNTTEFDNICLLDTPGIDNPNIVLTSRSAFPNQDDGIAALAALASQGLTGIVNQSRSNGESGTVEGIELGYQQSLDFLPGVWSNLGFGLNYTYADSAQPNGNQLLNISENTFNAQVYWEGERLQLRAAYNFRDSYLDDEEERRVERIGELALGSSTNDESDPLFDPTSGNVFVDDRGQLDISASYDINDSLTAVFNIVNVLEEPTLRNNALGGIWKYSESDRRVSFGIRGNF